MIFLGGGGSESDESQLWDSLFVPGQRVVVWPYAMPPADRAAVVSWFRDALAPRGTFTVTDSLPGADVLVIPGGNTYDLLAAVRSRLPALSAFLQAGGHVYGGSAGAILLGADIDIAGILDPNDIGLTDTTGADLLAGHVVYPHYTPDQETTAAEWAAGHNVNVLAIPETSGVIVDGVEARNAGPATVHVFTPGAHLTYESGVSWRLTT
ncbi:peptidase E [Actinoplanes bogorensis]|uniref:Peptidase E n=1 Tax=Paractinoplanes bogorensis TaxID=1610840 RepID=A0ABS5YXC9_9ACTN|nr:Type 1 glutamine amidotransferase-like domain-containing protein [Actinoplanes bogorensis]MBU2667716.1 peptidase E [Actinoplanes bogorensis]